MYPFFDNEFYAQERQFLIFANLKISNSVNYHVGLSLLFAKKMQ